MQSDQITDIVSPVRKSLPNSFSLSTGMEPTSVIVSHWICSTIHWDEDFNLTGRGV